MFEVGSLVIYGSDGVCRVENVGPLEMQDAQKDMPYYTLSPLYHGGTIFTPVDTKVLMRPGMTREEAEALIAHIPQVRAETGLSRNPRLLHEHYQLSLKSGDCVELVKLIRTVYPRAGRRRERDAAWARWMSGAENRPWTCSTGSWRWLWASPWTRWRPISPGP